MLTACGETERVLINEAESPAGGVPPFGVPFPTAALSNKTPPTWVRPTYTAVNLAGKTTAVTTVTAEEYSRRLTKQVIETVMNEYRRRQDMALYSASTVATDWASGASTTNVATWRLAVGAEGATWSGLATSNCVATTAMGDAYEMYANTGTTTWRTLVTDGSLASGGGGFAWTCLDTDFAPPRNVTPEERLRDVIRSRLAPAVIGRARDPHENPVRPGVRPVEDFREARARETLSKVVGADQYRRFLRDGFVTAKGKSGKTYQIFPGSNFTRVYDHGKEEQSLCVVLQGKFPPTDSLIVRFLMILNDEETFRSLAVRHHPRARPTVAESETETGSLADVYGRFRAPKLPRTQRLAVHAAAG